MKNIKKMLSLLLALSMLLSMAVPASAAGESPLATPVEFYVNNTSGSDNAGDGSQENPFLTIRKALETADGQDTVIHLEGTLEATQELVFDEGNSVTIQQHGTGKAILAYNGDRNIGNDSAFLKVTNGTSLTLKDVTVRNDTEFSARMLYASERGAITLEGVTVTKGKVENLNAGDSHGGAGAFAANGGTITIGEGTTMERNTTTGDGGAIYAAEGGTVMIAGANVIIRNNTAANGAGLYAENLSNVSMNITADLLDLGLVFGGNIATVNGGVAFVERGASVKVAGEITATEHKVNSQANNIYLATGATMDISGSTLLSHLDVTCEDAKPYRLVSNQVDGYTITVSPKTIADEGYWFYDGGAWDIRYMVRDGVPGLYLCWKTVDAIFTGVDTLTTIKGTDINGEDVDYLNDDLVNASTEGNKLTVEDIILQNGENYTVNFTCDPDQYRIPTKDVVTVKVDGTPVEFEYTYDAEAGTATITLPATTAAAANSNIEFDIAAEKYYDLQINSNGPLFSISADGIIDNRFSLASLVLANMKREGTNAEYKFTRDGQPVAGIKVVLYNTADNRVAATAVTGENGVAVFTGLDADAGYYVVPNEIVTVKVITRDVLNMVLSTITGQKLDGNASNTTGEMEYDGSGITSGTATIKNIEADGVVTFAVQQAEDVIYFDGNAANARGDGKPSSTTPVLSATSKTMAAGADKYGELATAEMEGYDFLGWFTAPVGGVKVEASTAYSTAAGSPTKLYAHWQSQENIHFTKQVWIELVTDGVNDGYVEGETKTTAVDGKTFYLYHTADENTGVADEEKVLTLPGDLPADTFAKTSLTWWKADGFTFEATPTVTPANGSGIIDIYGTRRVFNVTFTIKGMGTSLPAETELDPQTVKFGDALGTLPRPTMSGYTFSEWYIGEEQSKIVVGEDFIHITLDDDHLHSTWVANTEVNWAIKLVTQDIEVVDGRTQLADTYSVWKTVYKDNNGHLLIGTTDELKTFARDSIAALEVEGFNYIGFANMFDVTAAAAGNADKDISIKIKPTDASTDDNGEFNLDFDGSVVYLYYSRKTAAVKPDGDDGPGETIVFGGDFTGALPEGPGKDGYDFDHWEDEDGNRIDADTPADQYVKDGELVILYPTWNVRNYHLTYVPGEGGKFIASEGSANPTMSETVPGGYVDANTVTYDAPVGTMPSAQKKGHDFDGWYVEVNGEHMDITKDTVVTVKNVVISNAPVYNYEDTRPLYAKYTPHTYTLVFHAGQSKTEPIELGAVTPEEMTIHFGESVTLPTPMLRGYRFVSWVLDPNNIAGTSVKNGTWDKEYANGAIIHLYATYLPKSYQFKFDLNDDIGSTRAILVDTSIGHDIVVDPDDVYVTETFDTVYGKAFKMEAQRNGYQFEGWALTPDGEPLTAESIVKVSDNTTLYAIWTPLEFNVKFIMHGSAMTPVLNDNSNLDTYDSSAVHNAEADTWVIKVKFDSEPKVNLPKAVKDAFKFHGWKVSAPNWEGLHDTLLAVNAEDSITPKLPSYVDYLDKDGIVLEAVLEPYFTFNPDGGTFEDGTTDPKTELQSEIEELPKVDKPGYTQDGWQDEDGNPVTIDDVENADEPHELTPVFIPNITFDANGGKVNDKETDIVPITKLTELPIPVREGYVFECWMNEGNTVATFEDVKDTETPMTLTARWSVGIIFDANGGRVNGKEKDTVKASTLATMPTASRSNYDFLGWFTEKNGGVAAKLEELTASMEPVTVYAHWNYRQPYVPPVTPVTPPATYYTVTFDSNGGTAVPSQEVTGKVQKPADPSLPGYRLVGWFKEKDLKNEFNFDKDRVNRDTTLYAKWEYIGVSAWLTTDHIAYISGYPDGTVRPEANITRAEVATIFYRLLNEETRERYRTTTHSFVDVDTDAWYNLPIATLANMGILVGKGHNIFDPDAAITRAEYATICARFDRLDAVEAMRFSDVEGHWAYDYIGSAATKGWVNGYPDGTFHPDAPITRAEAMTLVNNVLGRSTLTVENMTKRVDAKDVKFWPDNADKTVWYYLAVQEASQGHDFVFENAKEVWTKLHDFVLTNE